MNQNRKEELLTRWMDGALSADDHRELEPLLAEHPELEGERDEYVKLRGELKSSIPAEEDPPYPDFFNVHLERLIQDSSRGLGKRGTVSGKPGWNRLWTWWMAPAATAALVAAFILGMNMTGTNVPDPITDVATAYSPNDNVVPTVVAQDDSLDATVIVLTGLDDVPDENLIGWGGSNVEDAGFFVTAKMTF